MRTFITRPDGTRKAITNLGWLFRHASEVSHITLSNRSDGARCGCVMVADLWDGTKYQTTWESHSLAKECHKRPSLRHVIFADHVTQLSTRNP